MEGNSNSNTNNNTKGFGKEGMWVWLAYIAFCVLILVVAIRIIHIQLTFKNNDERVLSKLKIESRRTELPAARGAIFAMDGRLLATSAPIYDIHIDCTVHSDGKEKTVAQWMNDLKQTCNGLATEIGKRSANQWQSIILKGRESNKKYMLIAEDVDQKTLDRLKQYPLFALPQNKSGIIIERNIVRTYPFDELARRTIGYVKDGKNVGLEGTYDKYLSGEKGYRWMKISDRGNIPDNDSSHVDNIDGMDLRTTIDIDIQDIANEALRNRLAEESKIEAACAIVMDVKSGAIRAMVNLQRDSLNGKMREQYNVAIGHSGEPGSVFKSALLMMLMEEKGVKLTDSIPTNHGVLDGFKFNPDTYITQYEKQTGKNKISVRRGYELSSNYVFRRLAYEHYGNDPDRFVKNLQKYHLTGNFDFDLEGFSKASVPSNTKEWSRTDLGSIAIGYTVSETPLHIITFYNAIANKGKMMKPYLVESIEKDGHIKKKLGEEVLNASICSKSVADSLRSGLVSITEHGTGSKLKGAAYRVGGKTGTSRVVLSAKERPLKGNPYEDAQGRKKYRATYVGFFPAENPKYTAIVVMFSKLDREAFYGGTLPALTFKDMVDKIYKISCDSDSVLTKRKAMPDLSVKISEATAVGTDSNNNSNITPNIMGLGLNDAVYQIENAGYRCSYTGCGHVTKQSPNAGTKLAKGATIKITLE